LPETQSVVDSNAENEKAQTITGHIVPRKAVGSKLIPAGKYSSLYVRASDDS